MNKLSTYEAFKRNGILLEFIKEHKGKENIVTSEQIADFLNAKGYKTDRQYVHYLVNAVMYERHAPICYFNAKGYYWASNRAEIENTIADLERRKAALQEHINHLKNFIIE
jgi:hypothetical protein